MSIIRFAAIACFLTSTAAYAQGGFSWGVSSVTADQTMFVSVYDAPSLPVVVEIFIDGVLVHREELKELPGVVSYDVPEKAAGKDWEVRLKAEHKTDSTSGTVGPSPMPLAPATGESAQQTPSLS